MGACRRVCGTTYVTLLVDVSGVVKCSPLKTNKITWYRLCLWNLSDATPPNFAQLMRQSVAPGRASQATGASHAATSKLLEKKKEFDAVSALERASALYLERIDAISEDCAIMADAGQGHHQQ